MEIFHDEFLNILINKIVSFLPDVSKLEVSRNRDVVAAPM